jgi:hypothetical protein
MPEIAIADAAEKLAEVVEVASTTVLKEIHAELFPQSALSGPPIAGDIARHIREGLEAEEIVDLWNVVFPDDRNVWYDEEAKALHFNEEMAGYTD